MLITQRGVPPSKQFVAFEQNVGYHFTDGRTKFGRARLIMCSKSAKKNLTVLQVEERCYS